MHCHICDADTDSVTLTEPCGACQEVIRECLMDYEDLETAEDPIVEQEFDVGC